MKPRPGTRGISWTSKGLSAVALCAALSITCIAIHAPRAWPPYTPMEQGAYVLLPRAEVELAQGKVKPALRALRTTLFRALNEGEPQVASMVHNRMATAGVSMLRVDAKQAWPLFEAYALLSPKFTKASRNVEGLYLRDPRIRKTRFEYNLVGADGRTIMGTQPMLIPRLPWRLVHGWNLLRPSASGWINRIFTNSEYAQAEALLAVPTDLAAGPGRMPTTVLVEAPGVDASACLLCGKDSIEAAQKETGGDWTLSQLFQGPDGSLSRVVLVLNDFHLPGNIRAVLIHDYQPL